jgi:hypothetical protein
MSIHPPGGPAEGVPCGQCGALEPLAEFDEEPRCADVTAASYAAALARAETLQRRGIWPGIVALPGGLYRLTFDPAEETS